MFLAESGTQLASARDYLSLGPPVARLPVNRYWYCIRYAIEGKSTFKPLFGGQHPDYV